MAAISKNFIGWKYLLLIFCVVYFLTMEDIAKNQPFLHSQQSSHIQTPPSTSINAIADRTPPTGYSNTDKLGEVLAKSSKKNAGYSNIEKLGEPLAKSSTKKNTSYSKIDELGEALAKSSTRNKTVIITIANKAYVEGDRPMLDLFLDSLRLGEGTRELIHHMLIVAMDQTSYEQCRSLGLHCYKLETEGVDFEGEKVYMSEDFIKMMWRRTLFLGDVLKRGYNFIFTDMDVLWLRNPFPELTTKTSLDLQISTDKFRGNPWSTSHRINTGFYMIRSNNKTRALFDAWYAEKNSSAGIKEQDVLQNLLRRGIFQQLRLRVKFLDTVYFSGFCQDSRDPTAVVTIHANCCSGMAAKLADLTAVLRDWKTYRASGNAKTPFRWSYHRACKDSMKHLRH